ncbi:uncharacterized protein LOC118313434 isoform X1 [Scophthalmus maximus]|nr:uncharacterized protein LOC118313434 isoform X1 [Scophthalmus maximus]
MFCRAMAGRTVQLLMLVSLLGVTVQFEVKEDEWEELGPDVAALHRLKGLSRHMFHEKLRKPPRPRGESIRRAEVEQHVNGDASEQKARDRRSTDGIDTDKNPMGLLDGFRGRENFTAYFINKEQDFDNFMADFEKQKIQDWLLSASEMSHSYSEKLLVMTDNEKSTNDQVQQEYSMDPHYSVIVTKECLYNESCLPQADSYTVVKICGSVSNNGQNVSGLSGSSLAELMLKPSLEAAPVFSLNGSTSTDFQRDFMKVFMIRGFKAVLEINHINHQIYQIMDQPDSVSSYQIPYRPVDHTTQYDHQQIIIMQDDPVVRKAAQYLYEKHPAVSSVYILDENQRPKRIHGDSVPLSEDSRLVLVGHGAKDNSGEMRIAGYGAQDVAKIIQRTSRDSDTIKTTSVIACEAGSDKVFVENLLRELHETAGITTELRLRDAVIQVRHTGEKITQEISQDGLKWQHKDDSTKVVATLDRNGDVVIRNEPGSRGETVFTNERNVLTPKKRRSRFSVFRDSWPQFPRSFIHQGVFQSFPSNVREQIKYSSHTTEAMSWAFFNADQPLPNKLRINNQGQYVIRIENQWTNNKQEVEAVLSKCYEIKSGKDVRNVIRHYAKTGEDEPTYLMVKDWMFLVNPENLYIYPVGKKLDNNQMGNEDKIEEVKDCITEQKGKEKYPDIQKAILYAKIENPRERYAQYVEAIFLGEPTTDLHLPLTTEAWITTYFTASVISESARNFRTFPLVLMALDMIKSPDNNIREKGLKFFFDEHPMARRFSWIDPSRRGPSGSATPEHSSKLNNLKPRTEGELGKDLKNLLNHEAQMFIEWEKMVGRKNVQQKMEADALQLQIVHDSEMKAFSKDYSRFKEENQHLFSTPSGADNEPSASGNLGGYADGSVTVQDLNSASELENSFKLESYFSRASASFSEQIQTQLKAKYGETLAGLHLREGSARIEDGQFICELVSEGADAEPVEFRVELSQDSQRYNDIMLENIDRAAHEMEMHISKPSQVNKYAEHTGTAVGSLGLLLGMKGAVDAFEQGDINDGVVGALQTAHGVTAMSMSVIARKSLTSEGRIARATAAIMRSPAVKGTMTAIPIVGIGFGIYSLEQDIERGSTLGAIDAVLDASMIALDVVELVQPELAPFIMPINLALSVVRMIIDDVYMGIQNELQSLPKDAGILDKVGAAFVGAGKGLFHFAIQVASVFYNGRYVEIEEGHRLVAQISDYKKYYTFIKEQDGTSAIDFSGGDSSWNGGGINFCLADQGQSQFCMNYFVSSDESFGKKCWNIDTQGSNDIILGLGESHALEYKTLQKKVLMFIPAGSVRVVSGEEAVSDSRYGIYKGNREPNRFFAVHKSEDERVIDLMLTYYYQLYGQPGDDMFFLGPQRSYVEGSGGKDTYIIPDNGGKSIINNYDPSKTLDTLQFSVNYSHISVSKSGDDVVFMYEGSHTVTIQKWFSGELYRHMNMMSGDGVLFEISSTVVSSVQLVARGINKMFQTRGETVNASQPLLRTVTNICGSQHDDVLIGNGEKNLLDGGGGRDLLTGGEGEDIYMVKNRTGSSVVIENYSTDNETDVAIIDADLHTFEVRVEGNNAVLSTSHQGPVIHVTLLNWFRSPEDRHLFIITKDLITFSVSDKKADCQQGDSFTSCIKSRSIDYSRSPCPLVVDLQGDEALHSVTEVRGSGSSDQIRGNKEHNVFVPGGGNDYLEGRGGEDWYVITPGQGIKSINNYSPDLALDFVFIKVQYQNITCVCEGQSLIILVSSRRDVILLNWFNSTNLQHLQIKTTDGVTAGLISNISSCDKAVMFPLSVDYRNQKPEPLVQTGSANAGDRPGCFTYRSDSSEETVFCGRQGKVILMDKFDSVKEMYGSSGFDIMVGSSNDNLLDPYTGGALMSGGEGKDTYIIKQGHGNDLIIDNFAEDQKIDTVVIDMDFIDGGQVALNPSSTGDVTVMITTKGEQLNFTLLNYNDSYKQRHLEFQSSDGVKFKLKSMNSTRDVPLFEIEAFKVTLKQSQADCRLDLSSRQNLSKVHTVQGCPSQSNDILGNDEDNALIGGWADDALEGGQGDDTLIGGNGTDILIGGLGDDTLYGEDGDDTMMGNSGNDVFIPGSGADLIDGGPGRDTVLYRGDHEKGEGVYVNLLTGQGRYADAEGDVLKDVETVIGTIYSDILVSGYESSLLKGSDGNDILVSTGGDYLVGGDGSDIYMLAFHHGSVTIDNCAKDNATDVLYLESGSPLAFDCHIQPDRVILTFFALNQTAVNITLEGWISDESKCGHLVWIFRGVEVSVDQLLEECALKQKEESCSSIISWSFCTRQTIHSFFT